MTEPDAGQLVHLLLHLEAERILTVARTRSNPTKTKEGLVKLDEEIALLLSGLERRGISYPGHLLGARYNLSGTEYMLLNLALMPHHSPSLVMELAEWTPSTARTPHWSWGAWLAGGSCADTPLFRRSFQGRPLLTEQLLLCTEPVEKDETLRPHVAVLELYGLGDSSP